MKTYTYDCEIASLLMEPMLANAKKKKSMDEIAGDMALEVIRNRSLGKMEPLGEKCKALFNAVGIRGRSGRAFADEPAAARRGGKEMRKAVLAFMALTAFCAIACDQGYEIADERLVGRWRQCDASGIALPDEASVVLDFTIPGKMRLMSVLTGTGISYDIRIRRHSGDKGSDFLCYGLGGEWSEWGYYCIYPNGVLAWNMDGKAVLHYAKEE